MTFPKILKIALLAPLLMGLTQCDRIHGMFKPKPEKPSPYAFDVMIRLSPKAEAAMKQPDTSFYVKAYYYGDALPAYRKDADDINRVYLGDETWNVSGNARKIHLHGEPIDVSKLSETRDGQPQVLLSINGSAGSPDNPLSCHHYTGPIRLAQQHLQTLDCEFDTETYWDDQSDAASSQ